MFAGFKTEEEIIDLVRRFEAGVIPREEWDHAGHLAVGLFYVRHETSLRSATEKMAANLLNHLRSIGIDLDKEMPFHVTLTEFWMRVIADFNLKNKDSSIVEAASRLASSFGKDLPLVFYSNELLYSDRARKEFVLPDKKNFGFRHD